jgi:hypothetical protein
VIALELLFMRFVPSASAKPMARQVFAATDYLLIICVNLRLGLSSRSFVACRAEGSAKAGPLAVPFCVLCNATARFDSRTRGFLTGKNKRMVFTTKAAKATKRDLYVSIFEAFAAFVVKFLFGSS